MSYRDDYESRGGYGGGDSYGGRDDRREDYGGRSERRDDHGGRDERRDDYGGRDERRDDYGGRDDRRDDYGGRDDRRDDYGGRDDRRDDYGGNKTHGGAYPAGGYGGGLDDDFSGASDHARRHAGNSGDGDFFSNVIGALGQKKHSVANEEIDEDEAVRHHKRYYGDGDDGGEVDDKGVGSAAAMQALKMFSGSGNSSHGDNSQSAFIGMAMGEASKLFDQKASQGQVSGGSSKESAVMKAGEMALKMYLKSNGSGGGGGGASGLLGLASKFL